MVKNVDNTIAYYVVGDMNVQCTSYNIFVSQSLMLNKHYYIYNTMQLIM